MYSPWDATRLIVAGFPIRKSPDQSLFSNSPKLIAAYYALHRLSVPRHSPCALSSLIFYIGDQPLSRNGGASNGRITLKITLSRLSVSFGLSKNIPLAWREDKTGLVVMNT